MLDCLNLRLEEGGCGPSNPCHVKQSILLDLRRIVPLIYIRTGKEVRRSCVKEATPTTMENLYGSKPKKKFPSLNPFSLCNSWPLLMIWVLARKSHHKHPLHLHCIKRPFPLWINCLNQFPFIPVAPYPINKHRTSIIDRPFPCSYL